MKKTVIGAFENNSEALQAKQELLSAGFSEQAMTMHGSSQPEADHPNHNPGFMEAIRSLFTWDLDDFRDESYADHYAEAVRRGHAVLTIDIDESEVDMVSDLMDDAGALDIDEKVTEWRSQGYGRDQQSRPNDPDASLNTWAGSDPVPAGIAGSEASSGLDRTAGGSAGSGDFRTDMDPGSVHGVGGQGVTAPPAGRHRVHVLPHSNPSSRNA